MGILDFLILGILAVLAFLAVCYLVRHRGGCGGGCAGCPYPCGRREKKPPEQK